jgi:hypothetical protein
MGIIDRGSFCSVMRVFSERVTIACFVIGM